MDIFLKTDHVLNDSELKLSFIDESQDSVLCGASMFASSAQS